jgi:hypothetical protein
MRVVTKPNLELNCLVIDLILLSHLGNIQSPDYAVDKPGMGAKTSKLFDFLEVDFTRKVIIS